MLQQLNRKRGQSTLEYAVLIVVVIGALLTMQNALKRHVQGGLEKSGADIGDQYSEGNMNIIKQTVRNSETEETFNAGNSASALLTPETTNTTENSVILNTEQEFWGVNSSGSSS